MAVPTTATAVPTVPTSRPTTVPTVPTFPTFRPTTRPTTVLTAGDLFVRPEILREALLDAVGAAGGLTFRELTAPWPDEPFGAIGGVEEACGDEDELIGALSGVSVALTQVAPFTARVLQAAPDLRLVGVGRGGPVNVDLAAATEAGIVVSNAPGRNAVAVAEFTVGLVVDACRRIVESHVQLSGRRWDGGLYRFEECGIELAGSTVGLIGFGQVGSRVAPILAAMGAHVLVHDPYVDHDAVRARGFEVVTDLGDLLARSVVVSLHPRVTDETRGMIGAAELAAMPAGSVLVNTARGPLLDYGALCGALDSGHLRAAALDTYDVEPLPADSRLHTTANLIMTPHIAGATRQSARTAARVLAADVARFLVGAPLEHCCNPEVLDRRS